MIDKLNDQPQKRILICLAEIQAPEINFIKFLVSKYKMHFNNFDTVNKTFHMALRLDGNSEIGAIIVV